MHSLMKKSLHVFKHFSEGAANISQCGVLFTTHQREAGNKSRDLQFVFSNPTVVSIHVSTRKLCKCHNSLSLSLKSTLEMTRNFLENEEFVADWFEFSRCMIDADTCTCTVYVKEHCASKQFSKKYHSLLTFRPLKVQMKYMKASCKKLEIF